MLANHRHVLSHFSCCIRRRCYSSGSSAWSLCRSGGDPSKTTSPQKRDGQHSRALQEACSPVTVFKATDSASPCHTGIKTPGWKEKAPKFLAILFLLGATVGPAIDGIHGQVHLLTYDSAAITLGSLHTSAWVFVLLGAFYATLGPCFVALDSLTLRQGSSTVTTDAEAETQPGLARQVRRWSVIATQRAVSRADPPRAALSLGVVAALHQLSCILYTAGVPYGQISAVLAATAVLNWLLFDGTPQGLALASLCAVGAPTSELLLMKVFGVWHYEKPDFLVAGVGLPSWVACCYFFYTPWLANAARALWKRM
ncbi:hypothetical protein COCOBI_13-4570 [Coccomyxa sp. Obi]|nr:hypothetical protein COCOBI_13-4570 [Coccomyxa sp. Obi]